MPVAASSKEEASGSQSEKKDLQELRKRIAHNAKVAGMAAKALGPLSTAEASVTKVLAKAEGKDGIDASAQALCEEKRGVVTAWCQSCRETINAQEKLKALPAQEAVERLDNLPFDASEMKITLKTVGEAQPKGTKEQLAEEGGSTEEKSGGRHGRSRRRAACTQAA